MAPMSMTAATTPRDGARVAALSLLLLLAACAGPPQVEAPPLPFHVAVVPVQAPRIRVPVEPAYDEVTTMRLQPDTSVLTASVARALQEARFARVTVLDEPAAEGPDGAPTSRDRLLGEQARAAGADMLLQCGLSYDPVIWRRENPNFWMNWVLFLLGGPFIWFLPDHTYLVECELDGGVYDVHALDPVEPRLGDRFARVFGTTVRFPGVELDFIDRADDAGDYALSFICPAGYLAAESDSLQQDVQHDVTGELARLIADALRSRSDDLFRPDGIVPFWIEPAEVSVRWSPGELLVEGVVHLDLSSQVEVMSRYELRADGQLVEGRFGPGTLEQGDGGRGDSLRFTFREVLALAAPPDAVQLELQAGDREVYRRSYTFPVAQPATTKADR